VSKLQWNVNAGLRVGRTIDRQAGIRIQRHPQVPNGVASAAERIPPLTCGRAGGVRGEHHAPVSVTCACAKKEAERRNAARIRRRRACWDRGVMVGAIVPR
jgi:hypothetical protein